MFIWQGFHTLRYLLLSTTGGTVPILQCADSGVRSLGIRVQPLASLLQGTRTVVILLERHTHIDEKVHTGVQTVMD